MWRDIQRKANSLISFLSGRSTSQLAEQVREVRLEQSELGARLINHLQAGRDQATQSMASQLRELALYHEQLESKLRAQIDELRILLTTQANDLKFDHDRVRQQVADLRVQQERIMGETLPESLYKGLSLIMNAQHQMLERIDDLEARMDAIKKDAGCDEPTRPK